MPQCLLPKGVTEAWAKPAATKGTKFLSAPVGIEPDPLLAFAMTDSFWLEASLAAAALRFISEGNSNRVTRHCRHKFAAQPSPLSRRKL